MALRGKLIATFLIFVILRYVEWISCIIVDSFIVVETYIVDFLFINGDVFVADWLNFAPDIDEARSCANILNALTLQLDLAVG